jgi:trehalose 6-phosphate phosphatase
VTRLAAELGAAGVLYLGDDVTDEDVFRVLPDPAVTVKVGGGPTAARHRVDDLTGVHAVLERLVTKLAG